MSYERPLSRKEADMGLMERNLSLTIALSTLTVMLGANSLSKRPIVRGPWNFVIVPTFAYFATKTIQQIGKKTQQSANEYISEKKEELYKEGKLNRDDPKFKRSLYSQ